MMTVVQHGPEIYQHKSGPFADKDGRCPDSELRRFLQMKIMCRESGCYILHTRRHIIVLYGFFSKKLGSSAPSFSKQ